MVFFSNSVLFFSIHFQAPKLDFRHSDNINYFFGFVRHLGLPEVIDSDNPRDAIVNVLIFFLGIVLRL